MFEEETTPKRGFVLVSGVKLHKENPTTFEIPSQKVRESRDVDNKVKLLFEPKDKSNGMGERMWVKITAVNSKNYEGVLLNSPVAGLQGILSWGDLVAFKAHHIVSCKED